MKFGVREICNVVFKAKSYDQIGTMAVQPGQPVLYIDSAKTSTIEGTATTVYAEGGGGNTRLMAWEGEKTLTFTVEDALLSPVGFAILSGAGLISNEEETVHFHKTAIASMGTDGKINLAGALLSNEEIDETAPVYVLATEPDGSISGMVNGKFTVTKEDDRKVILTAESAPEKGMGVFVDFYVVKKGSAVKEIQIDAENFAGYYYVEADTLFRRQDNGKDMPANITFPNVKIQSNFTFTMASTGDPSTFTFTMDAFPGYTYFDNTKKVLCVIQIVDDSLEGKVRNQKSVMTHEDSFLKNTAEEPVGGTSASNKTSNEDSDKEDKDSVAGTTFEQYLAEGSIINPKEEVEETP